MDEKATNLGELIICGSECEHHPHHCVEEEMRNMMRRFEMAPKQSKQQQQDQHLLLLQPNLLPKDIKCSKSSCSSSLSQDRVVVVDDRDFRDFRDSDCGLKIKGKKSEGAAEMPEA